jgi:hypothetical protein
MVVCQRAYHRTKYACTKTVGNTGEYRAIEPTNEEVILQAPDVYVER